MIGFAKYFVLDRVLDFQDCFFNNWVRIEQIYTDRIIRIGAFVFCGFDFVDWLKL